MAVAVAVAAEVGVAVGVRVAVGVAVGVGDAQTPRVQTKFAPVTTPAGGLVPVGSHPTCVKLVVFFCTPTVRALSVPPTWLVTRL